MTPAKIFAFADAPLKRHFFNEASGGGVPTAEAALRARRTLLFTWLCGAATPCCNPESALSGGRGDGFQLSRFEERRTIRY